MLLGVPKIRLKGAGIMRGACVQVPRLQRTMSVEPVISTAPVLDRYDTQPLRESEEERKSLTLG
jgi:hypothetical protein